MKNIFSAEETAPEVDPAFASQVPAGYFNAPPTPAGLPAQRSVELDPIVERVAEHAGQQTDWRATRIG